MDLLQRLADRKAKILERVSSQSIKWMDYNSGRRMAIVLWPQPIWKVHARSIATVPRRHSYRNCSAIAASAETSGV
jgi:hypothetical protein